MDGITLALLLNELRMLLTNAKITKIYQLDDSSILLRLFIAGQGKRNILITVQPAYPHIRFDFVAMTSDSAPPSSFCMVLRKHLESGIITAITQFEHDRRFQLEIVNRDAAGELISFYLICEFMGKHSNILLVDSNNRIIECIYHLGSQQNRLRCLLPGQQYIAPPSASRLAINDFSVEQLQAHLSIDTALSKALLPTFWGLSPAAVNNICQLAGLPPSINCSQLDNADIASLLSVINEYGEILNAPPPYPLYAIFDDMGKLQYLNPLSPIKANNEDLQTCQKFPSTLTAISYAADYKSNYRPPRQQLLLQWLKKQIDRQNRKITAQENDLQQAQDSQPLKQSADLILAHLPTIPAHTNTITVTNYFSDLTPQPQVTISLNPALSATNNANHYYQRYHKAQRGLAQIQQQLATSHNELAWLESLYLSVEQADDASLLNEIEQELQTSGLQQTTTKNKSSNKSRPTPPLKLVSPSGYTILIGRNNLQNEQVTFRLAQAEDIWLHAQKIPGSHVILQCTPQQASASDLEFAAGLAAWFSQARTSTTVPIDYTIRRQVKKIAGGKPGFVNYYQQKTIIAPPTPPITAF